MASRDVPEVSTAISPHSLPVLTVATAPTSLHPSLASWFLQRGWSPYPFQEAAWAAWRAGRDGLIHVPTGAGKTYAAYLGPLGELMECADVESGARRPALGRRAASVLPGRLSIIYVTPLRAVSRDIEKALRAPVDDLGLSIRIESRTGDTSASQRARQRTRMPEVLVTTPESLTLLLTGDDAERTFARLRVVIVDEWHELLSSKRGVQTELALARLRRLSPSMRTWGLSATLRDPVAAAQALAGAARDGGAGDPLVVSAAMERPVIVSSLLPSSVDRLPWAGHMGLSMLTPLLAWLDPAKSTLIFTNTRSQAERWFQAILDARSEWARRLALHHGSIDRAIRERIEAGLKDGSTSLVVCTSSLDLGVDFSPVERVVQIGSPKGIARLIQRAGRAGHRPGASCEVVCVPAHGLELVEIASARRAIERGQVEERASLRRPLDVLVQHLVTASFGRGFDPDELFDEILTTAAFRELSREEFDWCVDLVEHGGSTLRAYREHHRVLRQDGPDARDRRFHIAGRRAAATHRLNIGTITADATIAIRLVAGKALGSIEEHFVGRLHPGDVFMFAGRMLEFVRLRDMTAFVKPARRNSTFTPHWNGARFPLSTALSAAVRETLANLRTIDPASPPEDLAPELVAAMPIVAAQLRLSVLPAEDETLVELCETADGSHCFIYPFDGRLVHEGLAALVALRLGRCVSATFALSINDYGIELVAATGFPFRMLVTPELFTEHRLPEDLLEAINLGELARRQFREVARVAGLVPQKLPGGERSARQVQAGSSLLYEVFEQFDPRNLLLLQARREVLERHCEERRLARTLRRLREGPLRVVETAHPTPLALPLVADRLGTTLSTESVRERVARMVAAARA